MTSTEMLPAVRGPESTPFFSHAPPTYGGQPLQNASRYLAAGTYLSRAFERTVISAFLADVRRAVVPSYGFDLAVVLRHALRARRMRLVRDLVLMALWTAFLFIAPTAWLIVVTVTLTIAFWVWLYQRYGRRVWFRVFVAIFLVNILFSVGWFVFAVVSALSDPSWLNSPEAEQAPADDGSAGPVGTLLLVLVLAAALAVTIFGHLALVLRGLAVSLAPGSADPGPEPGSERVRSVLARIGSAQNGNITLHSVYNPFIGAGDLASRRMQAWSIVLDLGRSAGDALGREREAARVDPVVLHQRVRAAVREMQEEWPFRAAGGPPPGEHERLRPNERITNLVVGDHVVGDGRCRQLPRPYGPLDPRPIAGHPLIDPAGGGMPFSVASPAAIDAMIRHPQAAARYYQRISVGAQAQPVYAPSGQGVLPADEQDFGITTFVHFAVEGRMLYAEFAAVPMAPIVAGFRIVDVLPGLGAGDLLARALRIGWRDALTVASLPFAGAARTGWQMLRDLIGGDGGPGTAWTVYDYGALTSVREAAADADFETYVQELDVVKYTRMLQERIDGTVLDYLENECGVDVSSYRAQAERVLNNGVIITGGTVNGQVAAGASIRQNQARPSGGS